MDVCCMAEGYLLVLWAADFGFYRQQRSLPLPPNCASSPAGVESAAICHSECVWVCVCSVMPAQDTAWLWACDWWNTVCGMTVFSFFFFLLQSLSSGFVSAFLPRHVPIKPEIFEGCAKNHVGILCLCSQLSWNCWTTTAGRQFVKIF